MQLSQPDRRQGNPQYLPGNEAAEAADGSAGTAWKGRDRFTIGNLKRKEVMEGMAGSNRDNFLEKTRRVLAHRANFKCSFTGCGIPTSGPSNESPNDYVNIGVAAHIHAAAPGGPRFLEEMTSTRRSDITNAIWLCNTHSRLVDEDCATFTPDKLHAMKTAHEARVNAEIVGAATRPPDKDFVAIGLDLVFTGELTGTEGTLWSFRIDHFLIGELATLIEFSERFDRIIPSERFVLVNALGDGRQLAAAPAWRREDSGYSVSFRVSESFPRTDANELPTDLALNDNHDIFAVNGDLATVSGLDALPQKIRICLSTLRGEMQFEPTFGTRIKEYFDLFRDSPWLPRLIKLEVIRMACIPFHDSMSQQIYTPFESVLRVRNIERLSNPQGDGNWVPFRFYLEVQGVGPWQGDLPIFIPPGERPGLEEL